MITVVGRSSSLAPAFKATNQVVATSIKGIRPTRLVKQEKIPVANLLATSFNNGNLRISSGIGVSTQVRCAHTDLGFPTFDEVRRSSTKDPTSRAKDSAPARQSFTYLITGGSLMLGAYAAKSTVSKAVATLSASSDVLALAQVEINISDIPEGKCMTFKWRGKPVFVKHRSDADISTEEGVDLSQLRDPEHDKDRFHNQRFLVVVGVCTHLGCVPIANAGDYGGYFCPCHGSHYDGSGRIRKGPAPLNLEVPVHSFPEPGMLVVG